MSYNPLSALPPKARQITYAILFVIALALLAWKASEGDWLEAAIGLLTMLGFGQAAVNTPTGSGPTGYDARHG